MNVHHTTFAIVHTLIAAFALAPLAEARTRPGVETAYSNGDEAHFDPDSSLQAAVLDDDALESMEVLSASGDEIIMLWGTDTGCEFELSFTPGSEIQVLHGEDETCDFDSWVENNTTYVDATEVVSVWESTGWFEFFAYLAGQSGAPNYDDLENEPGDSNDYTSSEQREDLDDCNKAIIWASLGAVACGGSIAIAVGSTGATAGVLGGSIAVAVATCGMAGMLGVSVADECGENWREILVLDFVQWQQFMEVVTVEDLYLYTQVEDFTVIHDEMESLAEQWWVAENAQSAAETVSALHQDIFITY